MLAQSPPPPAVPCTSEYTGNPAEATVRGCNIRCRQGFYKNQRKQPNPCSWCACAGSHPGANATAYLFFDLDSDPTESSPANAASPELVRKYTGILSHFVAGLRRSQVNESKCLALGPD